MTQSIPHLICIRIPWKQDGFHWQRTPEDVQEARWRLEHAPNLFLVAWYLASVPQQPKPKFLVLIPQHQLCPNLYKPGWLSWTTFHLHNFLSSSSWRTRATPPTSSRRVPSHFPTGTASTSWWWRCQRWDTGTLSASLQLAVGSRFSSFSSAWWVTSRKLERTNLPEEKTRWFFRKSSII